MAIDTPEYFVLYDGYCLFCGKARRFIELFDWLGKFKTVNLFDAAELAIVPVVPPEREQLVQELHVIDHTGKVYRGFYACRKIGLLLPLLTLPALLMYVPGISHLGVWAYQNIARTRTRSTDAKR